MKQEDYEKCIEQAKNLYKITSQTKPRLRNYHSNDPQSLYDDIHYFRKYMYTPEAGYVPKELKQATDAALRIRARYPELPDVPLAENPGWPTEQDFMKLEQWFISAQEPPEVFPMDEGESEQNDNTCEHSLPLSWKQWADVFGMSRAALRDIREAEKPIYHFRKTRKKARKWTLPKSELPAEYLEKYRKAVASQSQPKTQ